MGLKNILQLKLYKNRALSKLSTAKSRYEAHLKFAEKTKADIEKLKETISPGAKFRILTELNRIIRSLQSCCDKVEAKLSEKKSALNTEVMSYVGKKEKLEQNLSDNEVLWREKLIEKNVYKKQKKKMGKIIKRYIPKIAQIRQKLDDLTATPPKKILKKLQNEKFKEDELNESCCFTYRIKTPNIPFNAKHFAQDTSIFKEIRKYKKNIAQKIESLNKVRDKIPMNRFAESYERLTVDSNTGGDGAKVYQLESGRKNQLESKFEGRYEFLKAELDKYVKEHQKIESKAQNRVNLINKELEKKKQLLVDLSTELKDAQILKENKIPLKKYFVDRLKLLPPQIDKCKAELKILEGLQDIYCKMD